MNLEDEIRKAIGDLREGRIPENAEQYVDYGTKYTILKPAVKVEIELSCGKVLKFDVTKHFKGVLR